MKKLIITSSLVFGTVLLLMVLGEPSLKDANLIFISMDTTRNDYIDTGLGARAVTPNIRQFAARSVVYENAITPITRTLPAHLSVLSSRLPYKLDIYDNEQRYTGKYPLIQELLKKKGYRTEAIISLGTLASKTGINRGFDAFHEDLFTRGVFFVPAQKVAARAIQVLKQNRDRKFFLFIHFSDPHTPYAPPQIYREFRIAFLDESKPPMAVFNAYHGIILKKKIPLKKGIHKIQLQLGGRGLEFSFFALRKLEFGPGAKAEFHNISFSPDHYGGCHIMKGDQGLITITCRQDTYCRLFQVIPILQKKTARRYYQKEIEYMDRYVGDVLKYIRFSGLGSKTMIVLFADHGEGLGERDEYFGHSRYLNSQFIRVPLVFYYPGCSPIRIKQPVSLTSIAPRVLGIMGDRVKERLNNPAEEKIVSFAFRNFAVKDKVSIINWPYQAIYYFDQGVLSHDEYYNLDRSQSFHRDDTIDRDILLQKSYTSYKGFLDQIRSFRKVFERAFVSETVLDRQSIEKLSSLGYIQDKN